MSNMIVDENGIRSTIYDSIELPNKGMIYLDSKAYDTLKCNEVSTDRKNNKWKTTITFTNNNIEYATIDETNQREYR